MSEYVNVCLRIPCTKWQDVITILMLRDSAHLLSVESVCAFDFFMYQIFNLSLSN